MTAEAIARALGGRQTGTGWTARCPAHDDHLPSLSISEADDGKVLVRCFAGCDQLAVITALRARGLWSSAGQCERGGVSVHGNASGGRHRDDADRTRAPLDIWHASKPAMGTPVEAYLRSRGLTLPLPYSLRFSAGLKHPSGSVWPAIVALVTRGADSVPLAIHRTFLAGDGVGKAPVEPARMMLGPCRGGVVRLAEAVGGLMVGEGIETCLAAMQATGRPTWAALSTSGLRSLDLPPDVREVIVLADGDEPGEAAANACAWRWKREGRRVRIARAPLGLDFNDVLIGHTAIFEEAGA